MSETEHCERCGNIKPLDALNDYKITRDTDTWINVTAILCDDCADEKGLK